MKKALLKDSLKEIKNTYKRFISILLMAFLGVGFFAGIRATSPDMVNTVDRYFDEKNVYDSKIISTLGLTQEDRDAIAKLEGVRQVYGEYSEDILLHFEGEEVVTKVLSLDEVNQVTLLEGRMPQNGKECLVEKSFCMQTGKKIGDILVIEETQDSMIKESQVEIVGTMSSPLYISRERDTSQLGAGRVNYNMYLPKESFSSEVYTEIYLTLNNTKEDITDSKEYNKKIEEITKQLESIKEERQQARYEQVKLEAEEEIAKAKSELEEEKQTAQNTMQEKEKEIAKAEQSLQTAQTTFNANKKQAEEQLQAAETKIQQAKQEIEKQENELPNSEKIAQEQMQALELQKQQLQTNLEKVIETISTLEIQYTQIEKALENTSLTVEEKTALQVQKEQLERNKTTLEKQKESIEEGIEKIAQTVQDIQTQIALGKQKLQEAKAEIEKQETAFIQTKQTTKTELQNAQNQLNSSKTELQEGKETLVKAKIEYEEEIQKAEKEIEEAEEKIQEIEMPTWYILDRNANTGYRSFIQDTQSVENLGKVFPIVFFVIATLISLTSMTRMVEEQRVQIGTMKALGYKKVQIATKYFLYASLACFVGGSIGMLVGFVLLPKIIWMMYSMMYGMPEISLSFNWYYALLGLGLASFCIIGATLYTVFKVLEETPAQLMQPKAPKPGKRVLLEKIPFFWKHLSFIRKVTVRNIFRYKKRFFMTIFGIAGCTALILTGFGIKDAISEILPNQYEKVYQYDMQIGLVSGIEIQDLENFVGTLQEKPEINRIVEARMTAGLLQKDQNEQEVQIIIPKEDNLKEVIRLADSKTKQEICLQEGKIAITEKVAQLLKVKKGDTIFLKDAEENQHELEISDVVENYIYHYIYMPRKLYEEYYGQYETNVLFVQDTIEKEQEDNLAKELLKEENISNISLNSDIEDMMQDAMHSLNYVVIVLIVSAGMLAFVVLYNLSNVNISERIRELATIKVLGFYDKEVYQYVTRETVILTIIGIFLGLLGGYFLNYFIMGTCEINVLRFSKEIHLLSYIYAIILTILFTTIVNIATYFALKKIDMIESLKSIE